MSEPKSTPKRVVEVGMHPLCAQVLPRFQAGSVLRLKGRAPLNARPAALVDGLRFTQRGIEVTVGDELVTLGPSAWMYVVETPE